MFTRLRFFKINMCQLFSSRDIIIFFSQNSKYWVTVLKQTTSKYSFGVQSKHKYSFYEIKAFFTKLICAYVRMTYDEPPMCPTNVLLHQCSSHPAAVDNTRTFYNSRERIFSIAFHFDGALVDPISDTFRTDGTVWSAQYFWPRNGALGGRLLYNALTSLCSPRFSRLVVTEIRSRLFPTRVITFYTWGGLALVFESSRSSVTWNRFRVYRASCSVSYGITGKTYSLRSTFRTRRPGWLFRKQSKIHFSEISSCRVQTHILLKQLLINAFDNTQYITVRFTCLMKTSTF